MAFRAEVEDIVTVKEDGAHRVTGIAMKGGEVHEAMVPGRDGSAWLTSVLKNAD